jgi:VCBS repeat-containing protein
MGSKKIITAAMAIIAAAALAACGGGSGYNGNMGSLDNSIKSTYNGDPSYKWHISSVDCIKDGDHKAQCLLTTGDGTTDTVTATINAAGNDWVTS